MELLISIIGINIFIIVMMLISLHNKVDRIYREVTGIDTPADKMFRRLVKR